MTETLPEIQGNHHSPFTKLAKMSTDSDPGNGEPDSKRQSMMSNVSRIMLCDYEITNHQPSTIKCHIFPLWVSPVLATWKFESRIFLTRTHCLFATVLLHSREGETIEKRCHGVKPTMRASTTSTTKTQLNEDDNNIDKESDIYSN